MNRQIRKEVRGLLPAVLAALVVPLAAQVFLGPVHFRANDSIPIFAVLAAFAGASSFGGECGDGTLGMLLAQPIGRGKLWVMKTGVLAVMMSVVIVVYGMSISGDGRDWPLVLVTAVCAVGVTPWLTLKFGDGLIAAAVTLVVEWVIVVLAFQAFRWRPLVAEERVLSGARYWWVIFASVGCAVGGWMGGYRALVGWEAVPRRGWWGRWRRLGTVSAADGRSDERGQGRRGAWGALSGKELRLHGLNLVLAAGFCLPFVVFVFYSGGHQDALHGWFKFYSFVFPVAVGAVAVAAERQWGVLEGQLAQPISARRQWVIKVGLCVGLTLVAGILVPWMLLCLRGLVQAGAEHRWFKVINYSSDELIFLVLTIFGSSLVRGTMRAVILGLALSFASVVYVEWIIWFLGKSGLGGLIYSTIDGQLLRGVYPYVLAGVALGAVIFILWMAFERFRRSAEEIQLGRLAVRMGVAVGILRLAMLFLPVGWR